MKKCVVGLLVPFLTLALVVGLTVGVPSLAASAQVMPPPQKSPRTPVNRQPLPNKNDAIINSRVVEGQATVIDGDNLRVGEVEIRLFGIVAPQLSASFGPQARAVLDTLTASQSLKCSVRDRDHDGRFLATCQNTNGLDPALELLRRGLAVTARGSLSGSDLIISYLAGEQAAQNQKLGLWSVMIPPASTAIPIPATKPEVPKEAVAVTPPVVAPQETKAEIKAEKAEKSAAMTSSPNKASTAALAAVSDVSALDKMSETQQPPEQNFFVRYQILIAGLLMLATALGILGTLSSQRRTERRDEMKAIAAALRGELMAARAVCQARLKSISTEAEDKSTTWPRIRSTLYQAYVGRLGWLGAELARQIASIYGQSSDYAAYYNANDETRIATPKRQALLTLVQHIEEILPRLALVEQTGTLHAATMPVTPPPAYRPYPPANMSPATSASPTAPNFVHENSTGGEATEPTSAASQREATMPLWKAVQNFARSKLGDKAEIVSEEPMTDYAALIEQDMANLTFGETRDVPETPPGNITKFRGTGS